MVTNKMPRLASFKNIVKYLESVDKYSSYNYVETDEFIGPADICEHNHKVIDKLYDAGYALGFSSQSPESYKFRVYVLGAVPPSSFQRIIGKRIK